MITREQQLVDVISFTDGVDEYGQRRQKGSSYRQVLMYVKAYKEANVNDPRYADATMIGITLDKAITVDNQIKIGNDYYQILYVIPSRRYNQVLMKKDNV